MKRSHGSVHPERGARIKQVTKFDREPLHGFHNKIKGFLDKWCGDRTQGNRHPLED